MFGFKFLKTSPTQYVFLIKKGKVKKKGSGLSFIYYAPTSTISIVPIDTKDQPFIFNVNTKDFQKVSVQGQFTYYVKEPEKIYTLLDFTTDEKGNYKGDGAEVLPVRITNVLQVLVRKYMIQFNLIEALHSANQVVQYTKEKIREEESIVSLGIDVLDISILNITATPEMIKALETRTREKILQEADVAIYERRNFAVEQERRIKENELQTQIAIEEKNKQIREEKMNAEIAIQEKQKILEEKKFQTRKLIQTKQSELELEKIKEQQRIEQENSRLLEIKNKNLLSQAEAKSKSIELELKPLKELSPEVLEVLLQSGLDSSQLISKAFLNIAKNQSKIGNLNISPELLHLLIQSRQKVDFDSSNTGFEQEYPQR